MSIAPMKRSMGLYSSAVNPNAHKVRLVLAEKSLEFELFDVEINHKRFEELQELNPYGSVPTLIDRDLVLFQAEIIMEYLDERFPHPPLMSAFPVARARARLLMHRINRDWYSLMDKILAIDPELDPISVDSARKVLKEGLVSISPILREMPFFLSEEFSLVDCVLGPLLWRLPILGIELPSEAKPVIDYAERIFERESFLTSLSSKEHTMRKK